MSAAYALQTSMFETLTADPAVLDLVPVEHIAEVQGLPAAWPSILFGEAREYPLGQVQRASTRVMIDVHVWTDTPGTRQAKQITAAVRRALRDGPWLAEGHVIMDLAFSGARYLPDPGSADVTHGVITFDAFMLETEAV